MIKVGTDFCELYIIEHLIHKDERGSFIKSFNESSFKEIGIPNIKVRERYFSQSHKNVIRGMHFQTPPFEHLKIVTVVQGQIIDVVLDLRKKSETYGKCYSIQLPIGKSIIIPPGFAHGFMALEDNSTVEYNQTTEYSPEHDAGILYTSFGFDWNISNPIISTRDLAFPSFASFKSPF